MKTLLIKDNTALAFMWDANGTGAILAALAKIVESRTPDTGDADWRAEHRNTAKLLAAVARDLQTPAPIATTPTFKAIFPKEAR